MATSPIFASRVFLLAGIYGIIVLLPQYFLEARLNQDFPPPITHPEHFYGFIGVALAWQLAFVAISRDPVRLRPMMLAAIVEKFLPAASTFVLLAVSRAPSAVAVFAAIDLTLGILFLLSYIRSRGAA